MAKGNTNRKTKKALGGLLGLLGSFKAFNSFFVGRLIPLSALMAAFRFPTFLKRIEIFMIRHYKTPVNAVYTPPSGY